MSEWGDDDDMFEGLEGEESPKPEPPPLPKPPPLPSSSPKTPSKPPLPTKSSIRRIRVKPMSAGMRVKWPEVASCLLTLDNGRQIMFVR
jgi:hypothetical protein